MINPLYLLGLAPGCGWSLWIGWFFITISALIFVMNDCRRGNKPSLLWIILTAVFSVFGMIAYMIWKSTQPDRGWRG